MRSVHKDSTCTQKMVQPHGIWYTIPGGESFYKLYHVPLFSYIVIVTSGYDFQRWGISKQSKTWERKTTESRKSNVSDIYYLYNHASVKNEKTKTCICRECACGNIDISMSNKAVRAYMKFILRISMLSLSKSSRKKNWIYALLEPVYDSESICGWSAMLRLCSALPLCWRSYGTMKANRELRFAVVKSTFISPYMFIHMSNFTYLYVSPSLSHYLHLSHAYTQVNLATHHVTRPFTNPSKNGGSQGFPYHLVNLLLITCQ